MLQIEETPEVLVGRMNEWSDHLINQSMNLLGFILVEWMWGEQRQKLFQYPPHTPSLIAPMGTKLIPCAVCRNNLFHHRKQGCFWDIYGREQVPAALLKCQSGKRTKLPCFPPARLILEQAEAELSFWPLPWCPRSWRKSWDSQPTNVFQLPGDTVQPQSTSMLKPPPLLGK